MRLLTPESVTFIASNVDESTLPVWDAATPYSIGATVRHPDTFNGVEVYHIYDALQATTGSPPAYLGTSAWLWRGPTNRSGMFEGRSSSSTIASAGKDSIRVKFKTERRSDTIALLGLKNGGAVVVRQYEDEASVTPISVQVSRASVPPPDLPPIPFRSSWWTWLFGQYYQRSTAVIPLEQSLMSPVIEVQIIGELSEAAQVMHCASYDLGITSDGAQPGIIGFSPFSTDEFGLTHFVPRKNKSELTATAYVSRSQFEGVFATLKRHENQLVLLDANNHVDHYSVVKTDRDTLRVYGKMTRIKAPLAYELCPIEIRIEEL